MKKAIVLLGAAIAAGCAGNRPQAVSNTNTTSAVPQAERPQTVTAHSTENQTPRPMSTNAPSGQGKWSSGGEPIDTAKFDAAITEAEKTSKAKPSDESAKKALAEAYYNRGVALTDARQYAAALGDYRRALKQDPTHEASKDWVDQIVSIYQMLKKEPPKEGEEPAALPFKKT